MPVALTRPAPGHAAEGAELPAGVEVHGGARHGHQNHRRGGVAQPPPGPLVPAKFRDTREPAARQSGALCGGQHPLAGLS